MEVISVYIMINICKLIDRKIIFWCMVAIILELSLLIPLSEHYVQYSLLFNAIVSLTTGIFGILIGFDLNRMHERSQFDLKMKKIFESFISEIAFNIEPIKNNFTQDKNSYHPFEYKTTVWDVYREQLGEAAVDNVIDLTYIYYAINYFKSQPVDVKSDQFVYLKEVALGETNRMGEWINKILNFYKKEGTKLELKKETIDQLSKHTKLDLTDYKNL